MKWLENIKKIFQKPADDRNYWVYVKCNRCGEIVKGRVDLYNHLSIEYGEEKSGNTFFCRKVLIGSNRCYQQITVEMTFADNRKLIDRQITGGKFVSEDEL